MSCFKFQAASQTGLNVKDRIPTMKGSGRVTVNIAQMFEFVKDFFTSKGLTNRLRPMGRGACGAGTREERVNNGVVRSGFCIHEPSMKELERLVLAGKIRHGNNPVLTWMMDNRVAELDLAWDAQVIAEDAATGMDFDALGFLDKELQCLLQGMEQGIVEEKADVAEMIEQGDTLVEKWKVEMGQVWELGAHRLAVGDCTDPVVMSGLMRGEMAQICWTDPPWNVDYGGRIEEDNAQGYKKRTMKNDNLGEKFPAFMQSAVKSIWDAC